jgi:DNA repair protein SbcC/Rad50
MLKSLVIQNFQSHRDTLLELDPGVNLIIGQSDSGKTTIIRALKWLATNRPLGDSFVAWGKDSMTVRVTTTDGTVISHSPKTYMLLPSGKNASIQEWSAIGTSVPESVMQALNLSELSWQSQMDSPFLLSASPGEVARTLNEVADLDKIDSTLVNINRMARDNRAQLTETARSKQQLEIDLSAFQGLDNQLAKVARLKEMERKAGLLEEMVTNGDQLINYIAGQEKGLLRYKGVEKILERVKQLVELAAQAVVLEQKEEKGTALLDIVKDLTTRLKAIKDPTDAEAELELLMDMVGQIKKLDKDTDDMARQIEVVMKKQSYLAQAIESLSQLEKQWKTEFPSVCPLCGRSGK